MEGKRDDFLIGFLSLVDITVLISMSTTSLSTGVWNNLVYTFDAAVVGFIIFSFYRRLKRSQHWRRYLVNNWYEIPGMIPVVIFAFVGQRTDHFEDLITVGIMLRLLAILYLIKLSRSIEEKSRMFGSRTVLQIFIIFFLTLTISSFLFYNAERSDENSQITSMGDALWWTLQTATTSTFGPNAVTMEGRIVGSIIMLVGIGITGAFISILTSGLTRSKIEGNYEKDPKSILKIRLAKGEISKEAYLDLVRLVSE